MSKLSFLKNGAKYPRVVETLNLSDYHEALHGNTLDIWVNWSVAFNDLLAQSDEEINAIRDMPITTKEQRKAKNDATDAWMEKRFELNAELWSCTTDEVKGVYEIDMDLYFWINARVPELREAHRTDRKKVEESSTPTYRVRFITILMSFCTRRTWHNWSTMRSLPSPAHVARSRPGTWEKCRLTTLTTCWHWSKSASGMTR